MNKTIKTMGKNKAISEGLEDFFEIQAVRAATRALTPEQRAARRAKTMRARAVSRFLGAGAPVWRPAIEKFPNATAWAAVAKILGINARFLSWDGAKALGLHRDGSNKAPITPEYVERAWTLSGCKESPKFSYIIKRLSYGGRTDWIWCLNKSDSLNNCKYKFAGIKFLHECRFEVSDGQVWMTNQKWSQVCLEEYHTGKTTTLSSNVLIALGKVSKWARYVLIRDLLGREIIPSTVRIRDLAWAKVAAMRGNYAAKMAELSAHEQWAYATGITPSQKIDEGDLPSWRGISKKKVAALQALSPREFIGRKEYFAAAVAAMRFFASEAEMKNLFNKYKNNVAEIFAEMGEDVEQHTHMLHDFLNLGWSHSEHWRRLALRAPKLDEKVWTNIRTVEKFCAKIGVELPNSFAKARELLDRAAIEGTTNYAINPHFAEICAKYGLGEAVFDQYVDFGMDHPAKKLDLIPDISLSVGAYTARTLEIGDLTGPALGLITNCCQHLDNAGSGCAKHGYTQENSRFLVIEKGGEIRAQSWVWLDKKEKVIVIDSLESKAYDCNFPEIVVRIRQEVLNRGYGLALGRTQYGHTKRILEVLGNQFPYAVKTAYVPANPPDYYDGVRQTLLQ